MAMREVDLESGGDGADVRNVGDPEMNRHQKGAGFCTMRENVAARLSRLLWIRTEYAVPVRKDDLQWTVKDVAAKHRVLFSRFQVDTDMARCVTGCWHHS